MSDSAPRCPLCAGTLFEPFRAGLQQCASCELVVNPAAWSAGSDARLEEEFFDNDSFDPGGNAWTRRFDRWNAARTWRRLRGAGVATGSVLEVGVGSGTGLAYLRDRGFQVEGCDLSASVCRAVKARHGITMHREPLQTLAQHGRFDVVVMNHVVEHVSDPVAFLRAALTILKPGGVLHVAVPNVASWDARLPGWTSYQPYHLVYFTPRTLRRAMERAGLTVATVATHEPFSGWFLALSRSLVGMRGTAVGTTSGSGRGPVKEALLRVAMLGVGGITLPVRWLQDRLGAGEEVVAIASAER